MLKLISEVFCIKGGISMAINVTERKPNFKNIRSHALNATRKKQGLNLQVVRTMDGRRVRISAKEARLLKKAC